MSNKVTNRILQEAFLESFVNRVVIHTDRALTEFLNKIFESLNELNKKLKEFAIDTLVRNDFEILEYKIKQEATNTKSKIYEELTKSIIQQKEFAKTIDFLTGLISSAIDSYEKSIQQQAKPVERVAPIVEETQRSDIELFLNQVKKQLDELSKENQALKEKNIALLKQIEKMEREKTVTLEKINELQEEIKKRDEQMKQLLEKLLEYKSKLEQQSVAVQPSQEIENLTRKLNSIKAAYAMELKRREDLEEKIKELETLTAKLQERNAFLEKQLALQKERNEKVVNELNNVKEAILKLQQEKYALEKQVALNIRKATLYDKMIMQVAILDEFLKNNPQYAAIKILSQKIAEGSFKISAEELGYQRGISLGAWLKNMFGALKDNGLVDFQIDSSKGFPKGWIIITEKGKRTFIELRNKIFAKDEESIQ